MSHGEDEHAPGYDAELRRLDPVFRRACDVRASDRVLDVGCGTGSTTRAAAHAAPEGGALGVDVSASAVERARAVAAARGPRNVTFECVDAQVHPFAPEGADLLISRFGTMFFTDPGAAFGNLARALCPDGRLVMLVWQSADRNEWDVALREALSGATPAAGVSPAFSLGDPARTADLLGSAGFVDVDHAEVHEPVWYGPDVASAEAWVRGFTSTRELVEQLGPEAAERGLARLRETLEEHLHDDGVWFDSRAWLVTARR
ncbi:class I SAM-dependent methyltransferase [Cellulomonas xylanilytica]|uniref:Methyltransferase n=1 Tax=Cellulomonas xylanilytica TaxID=233583 RepID=A0A510VE61_9CELL|nr:class I SAM-dependent methyltransferase [Cellulomonas xylanilytica]GEK23425.1 methyltransferase [Cellulomonas xylanilytica]